MQVTWTPRSHGRRASASVFVATAAVVLGLGLCACGHAAAKPVSDAGKQCGQSRSAANVPVNIEVDRGYVACTTALTIERDYAQAIDEGKAPGNGGGGPVPVDGWTCSGFPTPQVLKTGNASKCVKGSTEIMAILGT
jgi:hypothetical protein